MDFGAKPRCFGGSEQERADGFMRLAGWVLMGSAGGRLWRLRVRAEE